MDSFDDSPSSVHAYRVLEFLYYEVQHWISTLHAAADNEDLGAAATLVYENFSILARELVDVWVDASAVPGTTHDPALGNALALELLECGSFLRETSFNHAP